MVADSEQQRNQPGNASTSRAATGQPALLVFDPSPTSASMVCATLRLAGYRVLHAATSDDALALATAHGPAGDHALVALLLDMTVEQNTSAALVQSLAKLPGLDALPTLMIVSAADPEAGELSRIPRPIRASQLLRALRDSIEALGNADALKILQDHSPRARLRDLLATHLPDVHLKESVVAGVYRALQEAQKLPELAARPNLWGSLRFMHLDALLNHLSRIRAKGLLGLRGPADQIAEIYFDQGRVVSAMLDQNEQGLGVRLGELAAAHGFCTQAQADEVAKACPQQFRVGQAMVAEGVINDAQCRTLLREQCRQVTTHALTWTRGRFSFISPDPEPEPIVQARIDGVTPWAVPPLVLEGLRNRDLQAMQHDHAISLEHCFIRNEQAILKLGTQCLDNNELSLLELLNGHNTVREATRKLKTGTITVLAVLHRLHEAGLIEQQSPPHTPRG